MRILRVECGVSAMHEFLPIDGSGIDRGALRVVDYVDSSMRYVPLWILESSAASSFLPRYRGAG